MTQEEARELLQAPSPVPLARRVLVEVYHPCAVLAGACAAGIVLLLVAPHAWPWWWKLAAANAAAGCAVPGTRPWVVAGRFAAQLGRTLAEHAEKPEGAGESLAALVVEYVEYCRRERVPAALAGLLAAALAAILRWKGVMP